MFAWVHILLYITLQYYDDIKLRLLLLINYWFTNEQVSQLTFLFMNKNYIPKYYLILRFKTKLTLR